MAILMVARQIAEDPAVIRYAYGLDERFDRTLVIDRQTGAASGGAGELDTNGAMMAAKIKRLWRANGEFPSRVTFAG
ncbi:hypothetical protein GCM10027280_57050 [Micromonospora polyrhachis]|uniref:Uncharacterized protein n=1 Tax=Micromonospora polyrhachis TaxID=1282883 RepID=A0A7W7WRE7_9ACTN|nr:hypothetical protein [Micromonospora polyrhachis]MBB4960228.1 hypothetical protein [Micromonospora polyrhachis]